MENLEKKKPLGAGKSSFDLVDVATVFDTLRLKQGSTFLDLACGRGAYALNASEIIGVDGIVYAIDLWEEGIHALREQAAARGITNIKASVGDVSSGLPIPDHRVDVCLIATVLHDFVRENVADQTLLEIARILHPQGVLAIIEFKKIDGPPGPSIKVRLAPEEVERLVMPYGFRKGQLMAVGAYNYLITFTS